MANIQVLDKQLAELIAAGEVVERPASVVKELVENSIDAGATALTVEIKRGGVSFLRVTDDGCGIPRQEVPTAFLRHATSKIRGQEDLEQIGTLGFRGEALASISAVAEVELFTRTQGELAGTHYVLSGGEEVLLEEAGCAQGTTLVVRDLFFNTPARMKFLKTDATESRAVAGVLDNIALSHPEVSVRFIREGKEELHTPGDGKLKSAIYAVYGKEFTAGLLPVDYELEGVRVWGFVSKPAMARPNRSMQQFFINGRCVKSRTMMAALEQGFKGSLMVGKFPACVLHLGLSAQVVDVNVHPAKLEVRFLNERPIFDAVYHGVKTALQEGDTPPALAFPARETGISKPAFPAEKPAEQLRLSRADAVSAVRTVEPIPQPEPEKIVEKKSAALPFFASAKEPPRRPLMVRDSGASHETEALPRPKRRPLQVEESVGQAPEPPVSEESPVELPPADFRLVGEAFGTYMLVEQGDVLLLIDKHAAHERLLYEQLKQQQQEPSVQLLLEPVTVTLNKQEYACVLGSLELFAQAGFELEDFGAGTLLVRGAPLSLEKGDVAASVMEMAGYLAQAKTDLTTEHLDWLYHNIACRAAVKAGDESSPAELVALARRLQEHPELRHCPHGRPVSIAIKRQDLEKQFGRI